MLFGPVAQLGERTVRIPMAAHRPVSFSPRFRSDFSPKSSKIEKLEKILRKYEMNFDDLRQLNESQIKAVETDYYSTYGESISIMFDF